MSAANKPRPGDSMSSHGRALTITHYLRPHYDAGSSPLATRPTEATSWWVTASDGADYVVFEARDGSWEGLDPRIEAIPVD